MNRTIVAGVAAMARIDVDFQITHLLGIHGSGGAGQDGKDNK
jgi:hypothetical protein